MTKKTVLSDSEVVMLSRSTSARLLFGVLCLVSCRPHPHFSPTRVTRHRCYVVPACCQATCPMYDKQGDIITICSFALSHRSFPTKTRGICASAGSNVYMSNMTAQLLTSELSTLVQESKRKNPDLRAASEKSLNDLKNLPRTSEAQITAGMVPPGQASRAY